MRKRILPALLSTVLMFSLVTTAFAKSMTLVQETVGDPNKEFVYYVDPVYAYVLPSENNVEEIKNANVRKYVCNCGFIAFDHIQPNGTWSSHSSGCNRNYTYQNNVMLYKVTLKSGESVKLSTRNDNPKIYAEQEDNYSILYSTDGVNFAKYVNDSSIYRSETTFAPIKFEAIKDGTITIKRTAADPPAPPATAKPTNDALWVDGKLIQNATIYKINGNNYFKLRDVAAVLNGTEKQFYVGYDAAYKSITALPGKIYQPVGGELAGAASGNQTATVSKDTIFVKGYAVSGISVYKIAGNNYFKLRDLGSALGFDVDYQAGQGMLINTGTTAACSHNWATRHVAEVGHYEENSGTHKVEACRCDCGFYVEIAGTNDTVHIDKWNHHKSTCHKSSIYWIRDVPNDPQYVVNTPAHDETYCTICGAVQ